MSTYKKEYELKLDTLLLEIRKLCMSSANDKTSMLEVLQQCENLYDSDFDRDLKVFKQTALLSAQLIINQIIEKC